MSDYKFGPWKVNNNGVTDVVVIGPSDKFHPDGAPVVYNEGLFRGEEGLAKAALIAAAPDMLIALKKMIECFGMPIEDGVIDLIKAYEFKILSEATEAINKAEGKG